MRLIVNLIIFLALISFCFYWFNDSNANKDNPERIPYVGSAISFVSDQYTAIRFYLDSKQGDFWDYLENTTEVRRVTDKYKEIYDAARSPY